jgi:hypothetical protein
MADTDDDIATERSSLDEVEAMLAEMRAEPRPNLWLYRLTAKLRRQLRENWGIRDDT